MDVEKWSNYWLRHFLAQRGYSMEHSHFDNREWLLEACSLELEN